MKTKHQIKAKSQGSTKARFPETCLRGVRESHKDDIKSVKLCPFQDCENLLLTAGFNQISLYDCVHSANYIDLVSNYHNFPHDINENGEIIKDADQVATTTDQSHYNGKNPYSLDPSILSDLTENTKTRQTVQQTMDEYHRKFEKVVFNDVAWLNNLDNNTPDLFWVGGCRNGHVYVFSQAESQCILQFPASEHSIKKVETYHYSAPYWKNIIITIDYKNNVRLWNIDSIDGKIYDYNRIGSLIPGQADKSDCLCLLQIEDKLSCLLFAPNVPDPKHVYNYNDDDNDCKTCSETDYDSLDDTDSDSTDSTDSIDSSDENCKLNKKNKNSKPSEKSQNGKQSNFTQDKKNTNISDSIDININSNNDNCYGQEGDKVDNIYIYGFCNTSGIRLMGYKISIDYNMELEENIDDKKINNEDEKENNFFDKIGNHQLQIKTKTNISNSIPKSISNSNNSKFKSKAKSARKSSKSKNENVQVTLKRVIETEDKKCNNEPNYSSEYRNNITKCSDCASDNNFCLFDYDYDYNYNYNYGSYTNPKQWSYSVILNEKINTSSRVVSMKFRWQDKPYQINEIVSHHVNGMFRLYDIASKTVKYTSTTACYYGLRSFDISKNGRYLLIGGENGYVYIYDWKTRKQGRIKMVKRLRCEKNAKLKGIIHAIFVQPNQESIIAITGNTIFKFDRKKWIEKPFQMSNYFENDSVFEQTAKPDPTFVGSNDVLY